MQKSTEQARLNLRSVRQNGLARRLTFALALWFTWVSALTFIPNADAFRPSPPPPPTSLTATAGSGQIVLSWASGSESASYNVYRATVSGGPYQQVNSGVTSTAYADTTVTGGDAYYYVVTTVTGFGESAHSNEASATALAVSNPAPDPPIGLTATAGDETVSLSWTPGADVTPTSDPTSYNIKRATTSGGPYTTVATQSNSSYTDTGLTDGTFYYYVVTAVRDSAESVPANEVTAAPSVTAVTIQSAYGGNNHVDLSWTTSANASGYSVKRATTSGGPYTVVASPSAGTTSYSDTGVTDGTTYYYRVTALTPAGGGGGTDSNEVSATPQSPPAPAAPSNLSAMAGDGQVWLSWGSTVSGQFGTYTVERSTTSGTGYAVIASGIQVTSYKDLAAANGTTYYYVVVPVNDGVIGAVSNEVSATPQDLEGDFEFENIGLDLGLGASINDLTQVASTQYAGAYSECASFWDPSTDFQLDLGDYSPTANYYSTASGVNNSGEVVGTVEDGPAHSTAFEWNQIAGMQYVGDFQPTGINNEGEIAGSSGHAMVSFGSDTFDLGTLISDPNNAGQYLGQSLAYSLNDNGAVVGTSSYDVNKANDTHAFMVSGFVPMTPDDDLGTLGGASSAAVGVNNFGQAVGWSLTADGSTHAVLFDGGIHDLGTLGGGDSYAYGINDLGQIVGESSTADGSVHAFLYQNGSMMDLNSYLSPTNQAEPWDYLSNAYAINNLGEIVGSGSCTGYQRMFLMKHSTPQSADMSQKPTLQPPTPQTINSGWGDGKDWTMLAAVSPTEGLVLQDVTLGQRYMAAKISVPYYLLKTTGFSDAQGNPVRGELTPDSSATSNRCRLVDYQVSQPGANPLVVQATYVVDKISQAGNSSYLTVTQRYEFYQETVGNEPSSAVAAGINFLGLHMPPALIQNPFKASAFKPIIEYAFHGVNGENMVSFNTPQRCFFKDDKTTPNTATLYHDADNIFPQAVEASGASFLGWGSLVGSLGTQLPTAVTDKVCPDSESSYHVIQGGQSIPDGWDNYHQTFMSYALDPSAFPIGPGCPECVHIHWRWTQMAPKDPYGGGLARVPFGSNQDVEVAVTKYNAGEDQPNDFHDLVNGESLDGQDIVFWYSATGHQNYDRFFTHGGFFGATGDSAYLCDVTITQDPVVDVTQNTTGNPNVAVNDTLEYTYHIQNGGPQLAYNCVAIDTIPVGMQLVNATSDPGPYDRPVMLMQEPDGTLECWAGDSLSDDPSDVVTFHVYLKATQAGTFSNTTGVDASMTYQNTATANTTASQTITAQ